MKSIQTNLMFWVAGLVAGLVLMERWRRHGGRYVPVESVEAYVAPSAITAPSGVRRQAANVGFDRQRREGRR